MEAIREMLDNVFEKFKAEAEEAIGPCDCRQPHPLYDSVREDLQSLESHFENLKDRDGGVSQS